MKSRWWKPAALIEYICSLEVVVCGSCVRPHLLHIYALHSAWPSSSWGEIIKKKLSGSEIISPPQPVQTPVEILAPWICWSLQTVWNGLVIKCTILTHQPRQGNGSLWKLESNARSPTETNDECRQSGESNCQFQESERVCFKSSLETGPLWCHRGL